MTVSNEPIREVFTRDNWSLHVQFPSLAQIRERDFDHTCDNICDRDQFTIELVRRIAQVNREAGATVLSIERVLNSSEIHLIEVSFDDLDFIAELCNWVVQYTIFTSVRIERNESRPVQR